jgi:hypothetical protein
MHKDIIRKVELLSFNGALVIQGKSSEAHIILNTSDISPGVYFAKIYEDGILSDHQKVIIIK